MLKTQILKPNTHTVHNLLVAASLTTLLAISACSDSKDDTGGSGITNITVSSNGSADGIDDATDTGATDDIGNTTNTGATDGATDGATTGATDGTTSGATDGTGDTTTTGSTDGIGSTSAGSVKFPSAAEDTGPDGLIVTGLDSTNPGAVSPWLLTTFLFKNNSFLDTVGEGEVQMLQYPGDFPISSHVSFYTPELDVCDIDDPDATPPVDDGGDDGGDDGNGPPPKISGGANVVINLPSGPWYTYNRAIENGESIYTTNSGIPAEFLPEGATLSVPGDVFPTVAAYPLYSPTVPERLLPTDSNEPITVDSAFSWVPGTGKTVFAIDLLAYDAEDTFVGFAGGCKLKDDGAFTMPANLKEFLANTRFKILARFVREYARIDFQNGIVLRQQIIVTE